MRKEYKHLSYIEGWISIVINILLFILKYWTGIVTKSVAIIADAWHTLSDSITSIVVIIGTRAAAKPPDKEHPFGHERAELIASIVISVLLGVVGFNFLVEAINKLIHKGSTSFGLLAIIATIISVIAKEGMALFAFWAGKKTNSKSLTADGWHHQSDAITSVIILLGIFSGKYFWWIDSIMAIIIVLVILYAAISILKQGASPLIGETCTEVLENEVKSIAEENNSEIIHIHHLHIHRYGSHTELSFHIRLRGDILLSTAHELATKLEETIKERLNLESTIHMEPLYKEKK